jgi:peptide methionine sulfoxide reductase msrA/msrB
MISANKALRTVLILGLTIFLAAGSGAGKVAASTSNPGSDTQGKGTMENASNLVVATFAGGCFWCVEADFEKVPGVVKVISGYTGGTGKNPTYENYAASGHVEAVQVYYDPQKVSYRELLDYFWRHIDPTDAGGQFVDRGPQYRSAIFYHDQEQKRLAEESKAALAQSGRFQKPIATEVIQFSEFYPAEAYHQDYSKTHSIRYKYYRWNSGRDQFLQKIWGQ